MSNVQTAKPTLAYAGIAVGALGIVLAALITFGGPLYGWVLGIVGLVLGYLAFRQPTTKKLGTIAMVVGFVAVLVGIFVASSNYAAMI